ncbi:MAG: NYN domain-containing protein [Candidatus Limnocylindrales bacterium]
MPDDRRVLEGVDRLVVDGTNVLHALRRSPAPLPAAALIGRLRAIVPAGVAVVVVLDGSPEHGLVSRRVASGVEVRYSGRFTADEVIARVADEAAGRAAGLLVVTDDIELSGTVRRAGGRTVRNGWLIDRLGRQRLSAPATGRPATPPGLGAAPSGRVGASSSPDPSAATDSNSEAPRWSPGRGATRKRGNGRRRPSTSR